MEEYSKILREAGIETEQYQQNSMSDAHMMTAEQDGMEFSRQKFALYKYNHEHKISWSYLRADMLYPQYQPTITSLQQVNLDGNCASSIKYEDISSDISCDILYPSQQYNFSHDINIRPFIIVSKCYEHSSSSNHEHKISRFDMFYPQFQPTTASLQQVSLDGNCASSIKYEDISPDISCDILYPSQQYNFSQDINVGSFINVSKSYEHNQRSSLIAEL
ncbi:hypothetical protein CDAR_494641 [Caerostris darwini]|uniref:Uncharacterized protein n=1 Tax=Caerostris darwini TaxID=1538125 RepID=A0AAV4UE44_9ARAC|nr:hypothetical protein CDAR_494641 [Caerostris darwini]